MLWTTHSPHWQFKEIPENPKVVSTYHRSNPHIDSIPHPDQLLEAQPLVDQKEMFACKMLSCMQCKAQVK